MSMRRRRSGSVESTFTGQAAPPGAVADHWQVSQYVPIRRKGDAERLATGWRRAQAAASRFT